jgi:VanZ like family
MTGAGEARRADGAAGRPAGRGAALGDLVVRRGWIVWAAVILFVSVVPVGWIFGLTPHAGWSLQGNLGHVFEFGLFAVLVALAHARAVPGSTGVLAGAAAAIGYGVAIELIQWPIPYRSADPRDAALDVVGVTGALALLWFVRRRRTAVRGPAQ